MMNTHQSHRYTFLLLFLSLIGLPVRVSAATCSIPGFPSGSSRLSLDWPGFYWGILPGADDKGLDTTLLLRPEGTFRIETRNIGQPAAGTSVQEGVFEWGSDEQRISCRFSGGVVMQFIVDENRLYQLDAEGRRMTGDLARRYILFKVTDGVTRTPNASLRATRWKLTTLMGKPVKSGENQRGVQMVFKSCSSLLDGSSGCNRFFGTYEIMPVNRIRFSKLGISLNVCPDMETERELFRVLELADSYTVRGNVLLLNRARMAPLARFEALPR